MLLPGNKENHLITYNWQNIISMNSNIFSIIHISLIRKINIFLYLKKVLLPSKLQKCVSRETLNIVNCGVSYHDSLCIIIFFNFKKTGIHKISLHYYDSFTLIWCFIFFNTLFDCLIVHRTESIYTTDLTKYMYLCKHFLIPPYTYPI